MIPEISSLISATIGGLIGGFMALLGVILSHRLELRRQKQDQERLIHSFLQAVHDEVNTLWDKYMDGMGNKIEETKENDPILIYYPVLQDYFTVYQGNISLIGRIENDALRRKIVIFYTQARAIIDSYRMNNELVHKYEHWVFLHRETQNKAHLDSAEGELVALTNYGNRIRESHRNLKEQAQNLLSMLRKEGVSG